MAIGYYGRFDYISLEVLMASLSSSSHPRHRMNLPLFSPPSPLPTPPPHHHHLLLLLLPVRSHSQWPQSTNAIDKPHRIHPLHPPLWSSL
eukprot:12916058-Prorocentrum_lima.AAC.1